MSDPLRIPRFLERLLPRRHRDDVLGDLCESSARLEPDGWLGVRLRFWRLFTRTLLASWYQEVASRVRPESMLPDDPLVHGGLAMTTLMHDLTYAWRMLRRRPLFTLAAVFTLSLGTGAATTMFTLVNGVLLQPLPYDEPDALVHLRQVRQGNVSPNISYPDFDDFRSAQTLFESVAAWQAWEVTLGAADGAPERVRAASVSNTFFDLLRIRPIAGRSFNAEEGEPGHVPAVILSHRLWQERFGGDPGVVGTTLPLDDDVYTIVGVAPAGFVDPVVSASPYGQPALWRVRPPVFSTTQANRSWRGFWAVGRLRPGVDPHAAGQEVDAIGRRLEEAFPRTNTNRSLALESFADEAVGDVRRPFGLLMAVVGLVLLIACVNVTNLLLSHANQRRGEFAVRTALGAGRARIVRLLLTESLLLAAAGAAGGLGLSVLGTSSVLSLGAAGIPRAQAVGLDFTVLAFSTALLFVVTVLTGLAPAVRVTAMGRRLGARSAREAGTHRDRIRSALIVAEVAMAVVILVAAGLVTLSLWRLGSVDAGMDVEGLLTFRVTPAQRTYPTTAELSPLMDRLEERFAALPGVRSAGAITDLPMSGAVNSVTARRDDRPPPAPGEGLLVLMRAVTPGYFRTAGVVVQGGRDVAASDRLDSEAVVVVNDALARQLFPGENPIGRRMTSLGGSRLIVGVVKDVREMGPGQTAEPAAYIPYAQIGRDEWLRRSVTFMVRTDGDPAAPGGSVQGVVQSVDAQIPINDLQPMTRVLSTSIAAPRFRSLVFGVFGCLALALAAVGIGGVMAVNLSQRHREIAIRLAIGADPGSVTRLVVGEGARLTVLGAAVGLGAAFVASRLMAGVLFDVNPRDPGVLTAVAGLLTVVGILATYLPARRASRVAPAAVLRSE